MNLQKLLGSLISHRSRKELFQVLLSILLLRNSACNAFALSVVLQFQLNEIQLFPIKKKVLKRQSELIFLDLLSKDRFTKGYRLPRKVWLRLERDRERER